MKTPLRLTMTITPTVTVLPRVMQILSRRGYILQELQTSEISTHLSEVRCTVVGPVHWHDAIGPLLERLVDVRSVRKAQE
jgi:acetolactate synthase small subunit